MPTSAGAETMQHVSHVAFRHVSSSHGAGYSTGSFAVQTHSGLADLARPLRSMRSESRKDAAMRFDDMIDYIVEHTAIDQRAEAVHWLEETLTAFAKCVTPSEAQRLALELPAPASHWIREVDHERALDHPKQLYDRVQHRFDVSTTVVMERVQVALLAMARELRPDTRQWLGQHMGQHWNTLLEDPMRSSSSSMQLPAHRHAAERARTLSEGRPGSATPLSESGPTSQPGSVAERNPHRDRKVSSAQDVHAEPISSSKPRSRHPVSETE